MLLLLIDNECVAVAGSFGRLPPSLQCVPPTVVTQYKDSRR